MIANFLLSLVLLASSWNIQESENFKLHYRSMDRSVVKEVIQLLEEEYANLNSLLDFYLSETVDVFIHPDQLSMIREVRVYDPSEWLVGLAINDNVIHVVSPMNPPGNHTRESIMKAVVHELVHVCLAQSHGHGFPLWLNEGLAVYLAKQKSFSREVPGIVRSMNYLPQLADLDDQKRFEELRGYPLSYTIVEFLVREHGFPSVQRFIEEFPDYSALNLMSEMQLENEWHDYLKEIYVNPAPLQKFLQNRENVFEAKLMPNPIRDDAKLEFATLEDGMFKLSVLDPWGETMQVLYQRPLRNGLHEFKIQAYSFPPGIYYLELQNHQYLQLIRFLKE